MTITLHQGDIPADLDLGDVIAVDTESMGLNPHRDRLCLIQLSAGDGHAHLVKFAPGAFAAPNLKKMLGNPKTLKLMHYGRADIAMIRHYLGVMPAPVYCTKIVSRLVRTFSGQHGLKALCRDLLAVDIDKQTTTSDWGATTLTPLQLDYAASDVLYLHQLKVVLDAMLQREGRVEMAQACFDFLPTRALLDLAGWAEEDIFAH